MKKNNPKDVSKKFNIYKNIEDILKVDYSIKKYLDEGKEATPNKTPSRKRMYEQNPLLYTKIAEKIEGKKINTIPLKMHIIYKTQEPLQQNKIVTQMLESSI